MMGLSDRVAVVTGGTRGIGRATANAFAAAGSSVAICSRSTEELKTAAREIEERYGAKVVALEADILKSETVDRFIGEVAAVFGHIDILVNNAGGSSQRSTQAITRQIQVVDSPGDDLPAGRFESMTDDEFHRAFDQKVMGMIRMTRAALPHLRKSEGAAIVNIASTKGLQPPVRVVTSGIAWAATYNFSKSLSYELAPDKIRVNVLCVDGVITSQTEKTRARWSADKTMDDFLEGRSKNIPLKRLALPEEVADAIYFLASPKSSYITGQCLAIDGGGVRCI